MSESLELLHQNKSLKNKHKNKRCFIIGNGPSLNKQNIKKLHNELTIAVNGFWHHPLCQIVNASYWVYADPTIWTKHESFLDPMIIYFNKNQYHINLLLPLSKKQEKNFGDFISPFYFSYDISKNLTTEIELSQGIPPYGQNVLSVALMLSMYMGCSEIILVGMDHTWWKWERDEYEGAQNPQCYSIPKHHIPISDFHSYDWLQNTITIQKYEYYQLLKYSIKKNITIINATNDSALTIFPKFNFDHIITTQLNTIDYNKPDISYINSKISVQEESLYKRGVNLITKGIINDAINSFCMLLRINPKHSYSYLQLARLYLIQRKNKKRGNEYLQKAIEISPELNIFSKDIFSNQFDINNLDYEQWKKFKSHKSNL